MNTPMNINENELNILNDLLLKIHESTGIREVSSLVMKMLPELIPHEKSFFTFNRNGQDNKAAESLSMTAGELDAYQNVYATMDFSSWYMSQSNVKVYRDSDIVSVQMMNSSQIYTDWVHEMGMQYVCGNVIRDENTKYADLTLFRKEEHGDYSDQEMMLFSIITDHLILWFKKNYSESALSAALGQEEKLGCLTDREKEVALLACGQLSMREIADQLSITYSTARQHLANVYKKLNVNSRVELINKIN